MADGGRRVPVRARGLVPRTIGDEMVVHDPRTMRAHALNATAAAVLASVDDHRTADELVPEVAGRLGAPVGIDVVEVALGELGAAGLIEVRGADELARRSLLKKAVAAAAVGTVALPVVQSIVTPSVAAAQSGDIDPGPDPEPDPDPDPDLDPDPGQLFAGSATTFGGTTQGAANGSLTVAQFNGPRGIAVAPDGTIYIADTTNHRIRAISPAGIVSTLAGGTQGSANGTGTAAQFNNPSGVAVGPNGLIYVADTNNSRIRAITPAGVVTTFAGSSYGTGQGFFASPRGVAVAADGTVYVADTSNHNIVALTPSAAYTRLAGNNTFGFANGSGASARFNGPQGIVVVSPTVLAVADTNNRRVRLVTTSGVVTTLAGIGGNPITSLDGNNTIAKFLSCEGITVAPTGVIYVAETTGHRIRAVSPTGVVTTIAGSTQGSVDGTGAAAQFNSPSGITIGPDGSLLITERGSHRIRKVM